MLPNRNLVRMRSHMKRMVPSIMPAARSGPGLKDVRVGVRAGRFTSPLTSEDGACHLGTGEGRFERPGSPPNSFFRKTFSGNDEPTSLLGEEL
ncbi:hypothetical protein FQA47_000206 [Oryzias melastigma]|uniref:Uncharacterized protein n=1 Tax=Oryzias melastigma TaxID=30732 RepID=A0A834C4J3_ORYME|nr:hypothetical protein FQA47_000206 [Oryzias melastigma]